MSVPKPEHPRPQFVRPDWLTLNGEWQFEIDAGNSGIHRGLLERELSDTILVPFAPESTASGIGNVDYLNAVWYRRTVTIPAEWGERDVLLHFGAVDQDATVWVNGTEVMRHRGGFTSFTADLAGVASPGEEITIVVRAQDDPHIPQARGKQATWYSNTGCHYTRTTGIWQSVWLEAVPAERVTGLHLVPNLATASLTAAVSLSRSDASRTVRVTVSDEAGEIVSASAAALDMAPSLTLTVPADRLRPWSPSDPHLYDVVVELLDGESVLDRVESYAGIRSVSISGRDVLINGEPIFQRLVLDQGYWPETLMTSPSDEALRADIELAMAAGFNGARLHQKVFEERFYYHADKLGYLVWGEFGDWGAGGFGSHEDHQKPTASFITQWVEALIRDRNHPSIVGWCPLNETYQILTDDFSQLSDVTHGMYLATKAADPTRPVLDTSGYSHLVRGADVWDSHDYEQDPAQFAKNQAGLADGEPWKNDFNGHPISLPYAGQPYFVSEYGGIWWNPALAGSGPGPDSGDPERAESWGYGQRVASEEEWYARFQGLTDVLLDDPLMFGYCYTQLTDTFQEENGLYDFNRKPKFDMERVRAIQQRRAAYEQRD